MITLLQAFLSQVEILLVGFLLITLRHIISGDQRPILDTYPDYLKRDLKNKYWMTYLFVLWFGVFTWVTYYYQVKRFGIWGYLFAYDNKLGWLLLFLMIITRVGIYLYDRFYPNND